MAGDHALRPVVAVVAGCAIASFAAIATPDDLARELERPARRADKFYPGVRHVLNAGPRGDAAPGDLLALRGDCAQPGKV